MKDQNQSIILKDFIDNKRSDYYSLYLFLLNIEKIDKGVALAICKTVVDVYYSEHYIKDVFKATSDINDIYNNLYLSYTNKYKDYTFTFKVSIDGYDKDFYRIFEVSGNTTIYDLVTIILSMFYASISHLWEISNSRTRFVPAVDDFDYEIVRDDLRNVSSSTIAYIIEIIFEDHQLMKLNYDFGEDWNFNIELLDYKQNKLPKNSFKIIEGKGYGIIEDSKTIFDKLADNTPLDNDEEQWLGKCDVNEFNIEKITRYVKYSLKMMKKQ